MSVCLSIEMPSGGVEPWIICQFGAGFPTGRGSFGESSIGHAHTHAVDIFSLIRKGQERCGLQPPVLQQLVFYAGQSSSHLQVLDLGNNQLTSIAVHCFRGLDSLAHLDLSGNSIVDVEDGSLSELRRLTRLDLRDNRIETLTASTFRGLKY